MSREFRVFEVDKYENRFFVARHSTLESANYFIKKMKPSDEKWIVEDENGEKY